MHFRDKGELWERFRAMTMLSPLDDCEEDNGKNTWKKVVSISVAMCASVCGGRMVLPPPPMATTAHQMEDSQQTVFFPLERIQLQVHTLYAISCTLYPCQWVTRWVKVSNFEACELVDTL